MKKTITTVTALLACAGAQLLAQNAKQGVITLSLTAQGQASVSTSKTASNFGTWEAGPLYYKTAKTKVATANVLQAIAKVVHNNAGFYSSKAQLVLVQGELAGFFNLGQDLASEGAPTNPGVPSSTTPGSSTIDGLVPHLATGRHFVPNPTTGAWPPGHHQPWGQIWVQDPTKGICENVTFFFCLTVEECYDCFYLSSFLSDTTFTVKSGGVVGPPCCGTSSALIGNGKDYYYLTLDFDNTKNNPYLNPSSDAYVGYTGGPYEGILPVDVQDTDLPADGITPDLLPYASVIASQLGKFEQFIMRFTLHGIVTYQWSLKFVNSSDVLPDFIGKGSYAANGYGFIALTCQLLTGSASINEAAVKLSSSCLPASEPWYDNWYATGWNQGQSPWDTFGTALGLDNPGFGSPINTPVDLSFHYGFDEEYEPGEQWLTNPTPDVPVPTLDGERTTFVPVGKEAVD
jgi:hypothetical protein